MSNICKEILEKPIDEITEDIFFSADNFVNEEWYFDLCLYRNIGVCSPDKKHIEPLQKALKILGYKTQIKEKDNKLFLIPFREKSRNTNLER